MSARLALLGPFLAQARRKAFRPGQFECALFAADWVVALGHPDPAAPWRGKYSSIAQGLVMVRRDGYENHVDVFARTFREIEGAHAALPGDLACVIEEGERAMGIIGGPVIHVVHPERGLGALPLSRAVRVFRP